jgi:tRNA(adenine34) deaminase
MILPRRALLLSASAVAGMAASAWSGARARDNGTRSVVFTSADELPADERARHERYMTRALDLLEVDDGQGLSGPFAAVIVNRHTGEIVCEGVNRYRDSPTFHGEIVAINACARLSPRIEWRDLALYTTAEPCPMYMAAIVWTRIPEVVYGTSVEALIEVGADQFRLDSPTVAAAAPFYSGRIIGGVLKERADPIYRRWAAASP